MEGESKVKDLLLYIARNLVEKPEAVSVTAFEDGQELKLELRVAPDDMGKVIGRQGRIAKEIRTLIRSCAQHMNLRVSVDIVDILEEDAEPEEDTASEEPVSETGGLDAEMDKELDELDEELNETATDEA